MLGYKALERVKPSRVVGGCGRLGLGGWASRYCARKVSPKVVPRQAEPVERDHDHAKRPALPRLLEHELAVVARERHPVAEGGVDPGQVARSCAHLIAGWLAVGTAVPIMQSRVTIAASSSSLQPSVPSGRIGSTR